MSKAQDGENTYQMYGYIIQVGQSNLGVSYR
jgi:hypothetical protein